MQNLLTFPVYILMALCRGKDNVPLLQQTLLVNLILSHTKVLNFMNNLN